MDIDWNNKQDVLEAVQKDSFALEYASNELKADREHASNELKEVLIA